MDSIDSERDVLRSESRDIPSISIHSEESADSDSFETGLTDSDSAGNFNSNEDETYVPQTEENICSRKKRRYHMVQRTKQARTYKQRIDPADSFSSLCTLLCCKKKRCFRTLNRDYLREKVMLLRNLTVAERKATLHSMLGSDSKYYFDGLQVCSTFLLNAFRFSRDMQCAIRKGDLTVSYGIHGNEEAYIASDRGTHAKGAVQRDSIVSFLERLAENTGDKMPDSNEMHLPFFKKKEVFLTFVDEFNDLYPSSKAPTEDYFLRTWKFNCFHVKVRKNSRFTKCDTCEHFRMALHTAVVHRKPTDELKYQRKRHLDYIRRERLEYKKNRDRAILEPNSCISLIIDGADQSAFGLPHFTTKVKSERGHSLKVKLVGVLQHAIKNKLRLYTLTEEHKTGANHIIEALHRSLMDIYITKQLPKVMYIQVDNCTRENKNRFFFSYLESLVEWKVFDHILVGFLPIGHTHEDIDQSFSSTSERLRSNNAVTISDLQQELKSSYNDQTEVSRMENMVNWSDLCQQEKCLSNVQGFSQYHYFRFYRTALEEHNASSSDTESTMCQVRVKSTDEWICLDSTNKKKSFLKFPPNLERTPGTKVTCPPNVTEVTKRIESEEWRISSSAKLNDLKNLRDEVFNERFEPFTWDLTQCYETRCATERTRNHISGTVVEPVASNNYDYDVNSFVAVRQTDSNSGFWIARILEVQNSPSLFQLKVHWFEATQSTDTMAAKYRPAYLKNKGQDLPWIDIVEDESVIVSFEALTRANCLPMSSRKIIQSATI